jgi:hypothetical protein
MTFDEERANRMYPSTAPAGSSPASRAASVAQTPPAPTADEQRAGRLYSTTTAPADAEPAAPVVREAMKDPAQTVADRLYPAPAELKKEDLPPALAELRNDPLRRIYDAEKSYRGSGISTLFEGQATAPNEVRAWSEVFADHDASHDEASTLVHLVRTVKASPPTDEVVTKWGQDAVAQLKAQYGDRAGGMLADARRLVAGDPRVADLLMESGLGSHGQVVSMFIEKAASLRAAGRLK